MKRNSLIALLLAVLMVCSLAGCTQKAATTPAGSDAGKATEAPKTGGDATPEGISGEPAIVVSDVPEVVHNPWALDNKLNDGSQTADELYELAKAEGAVVLYSISSRCGKVADSFNAQYPGVICEAYDISSDELMEKVTREYAAGVRNADVVHCKDLDGSVYMEQVLNNVFHNYYPDEIVSSVSNKALLTYSMPLYLELNQWFYNGNLYTESPIDSWWDLTRPEWKGNLLMQDPISNHNYMAVFASFPQYSKLFEEEYEREFGEKITYTCGVEDAAYELIYRLFQNDIVFTASSDETCESTAGVGVTEKKLGYGASSKVRKNKDNGWALVPINILPATGIPNPNNLYIVDECPHPNAAKLLVRWMLGEKDGTGKGFDPFNTLGGWSIRDNVALAEGSTPLSELHVFDFDCMYVYQTVPEMEDFLIKLLN